MHANFVGVGFGVCEKCIVARYIVVIDRVKFRLLKSESCIEVRVVDGSVDVIMKRSKFGGGGVSDITRF